MAFLLFIRSTSAPKDAWQPPVPWEPLHLNEDIVYIEREYLDDRRFVPVVTDLERKAQPIIRYRLNDILVERKEPCGCGSPFLALEKIEGREDDVFFL